MAGKLRRWLREAAVFLALLIAIMVVMDVWRALPRHRYIR
ncbi:hypothetical protein LTSESEN_1824 [Salmonella enterica subsp. enterica serovar Senftenberg str. A4-543]|uniref:Uncharacterized protein n=1 Tax=Salmonella enterica subsp. enterica serovar Senftenberg str. A4-543 TaxID=913082 RepID=G5QYC3_SALSE|nr:hypothetical protein LTSESEN_1824 [Salmonella enterica subsp. enterica serovar Senftenberg str. A4-543]